MPIMHKLTDANGKSYEISDELLQQLVRASADDVVPEGASVRVATMMRDGRPQHDSRFDPPTMDQLQAVADARAEWIERTCNAWRNNNAAPPAVADTTQRKRTIPNDKNVPPPMQPPHQPVKDEREAAYAEYLDYLQNAWHREKEA